MNVRKQLALAHRDREREHRADVDRIDHLVTVNSNLMRALLADVERANGAGDRVVVVQAHKPGAPDILVYDRAQVLSKLRELGRVLEVEELETPLPDNCFFVLVGTENVLEVRIVERARDRRGMNAAN